MCYKYKCLQNITGHILKQKKSLILSLVLYLLCPSNPIAPPLSFSLPLYIDAGI